MRLLACLVIGVATLGLAACSSASESEPAGASEDEVTAQPGGGASDGTAPVPVGTTPVGPGGATCTVDVTTDLATLGKAKIAGEHALVIEAASSSKTSWAEKGNEALVLEVLRGTTRIGHVVL